MVVGWVNGQKWNELEKCVYVVILHSKDEVNGQGIIKLQAIPMTGR